MIRRLMAALLLALAPPVCAVCRREGHWWCQPTALGTVWPRCLSCRADYHHQPTLACRQPLPLVVVGSYRDPDLRAAIHRWKYDGFWQISSDWAATMATAARPFAPDPAVLIPIPLHWTRRLRRGFNQATVLATQIAQFNHWAVRELLRRPHPTAAQAKMTAKTQRRQNIAGAFRAVEGANAGQPAASLWLVDDVVTTGATIAAARAALKRRGLVIAGVLAVAATNDTLA